MSAGISTMKVPLPPSLTTAGAPETCPAVLKTAGDPVSPVANYRPQAAGWMGRFLSLVLECLVGRNLNHEGPALMFSLPIRAICGVTATHRVSILRGLH